MQVSDLYFRLKLITFGFLSPIFIGLGLLFASPYFLKVSEPFHKSELAVLEANSLPSKKFLNAVGNLYQKKTFSKLIIFLREDKVDFSLISVNEKEEKLISYLVSAKIDADKIQIVRLPLSKNVDSDEAAKGLLKIAVSENIKSVLVLTKEFESKRILRVYQKNLASLPVQISMFPFPSDFSASNWFLSEEGLKDVCFEGIKYLYYMFRGII